MRDNEKYLIWSMVSGKFMTFDGESLSSSGTGEGELSKITSKRDTKATEIVNSFHLTFQRKNGSKYAISADYNEDAVSVKELTDESPNATVAFVPQLFGGGPFSALILKTESSSTTTTKCIASNRSGTLTLKKFDGFSPHPDTLFIITEA
ncbi:uncharacterized protein [Montipora capricornis]